MPWRVPLTPQEEVLANRYQEIAFSLELERKLYQGMVMELVITDSVTFVRYRWSRPVRDQ